MNSGLLSADNYIGRLNMDIFTNVEKSITEAELEKAYPTENFLVFEKSGIDKFMSDTFEASGGEIIKGGFNDTKEVKDLLSKATETLSALKRVSIRNNDGVRHVYILEKSGIGGFNKEDTLQKGQINDSLSGYMGGGISFKKKGSDIIAKVGMTKLNLEDKRKAVSKEISNLSENFVTIPKEDYWDKDLDCPYKMFPWNLTTYGLDNASHIDSDGENAPCCNSTEEAETNRKYNELVYEYCDIVKEIGAINFYEANIEENQTYEMTANQMKALGF